MTKLFKEVFAAIDEGAGCGILIFLTLIGLIFGSFIYKVFAGVYHLLDKLIDKI